MVKGTQKVNPIGWRVGVHRKWKTTWFQENKNYTNFLITNLKVNEMIKVFLNYHPKKSLLINLNIFKNSMDKLYIFIFYYRYRFFMKKRFKKLKKIQDMKKKKLIRSLSYDAFKMYKLKRQNLKISRFSTFIQQFLKFKNKCFNYNLFLFKKLQKNWVNNFNLNLNVNKINFLNLKKYILLNIYLNKNFTKVYIISILKFLFSNQNFSFHIIDNFIKHSFNENYIKKLKWSFNNFLDNKIIKNFNFKIENINGLNYNLKQKNFKFKIKFNNLNWKKINKISNFQIYKEILKNKVKLLPLKKIKQFYFNEKNFFNQFIFKNFIFYYFLKHKKIKLLFVSKLLYNNNLNNISFLNFIKKNKKLLKKSNDIFFFEKKLTYDLQNLQKILQILTRTKTSLIFINTLSLYLFFSKIWYKSLNTLKPFAWKSFKLKSKKRFFFLEKFANKSENMFKKRFEMGIHHVKDLVYISLLTIVFKRPKILAKFIGFQIKNLPKKRRQIPFIRQIMRLILSLTGRKDILGACIQIKGRFDRWKRTKSLVSSTGILPLQTFNINIEYGSSKGVVRKGTFGIRIWIRYKKSFNWFYKYGFEQYFYYSKLKKNVKTKTS